jgi:hypothetical protein
MSANGKPIQRAAQHRSSHLSLLQPHPGGKQFGSVDAVVVPTRRPADLLVPAIDLTRGLNCPIVVLCSGDSRAPAAGSLLTDVVGVAATVASTPRSSLLDLHTHRFASALSGPYLDTGNKRNVALLLGRMLGWKRMLFVDDDIRGLEADDVTRVAAGVGPAGLQAVGWPYSEFPDNSVVCHALRSSGQPQEVFPGSGALLIALSGWLPFFPPVYNEDWLFLHDFVKRGQVGSARNIRQLPFDPFDPARARREEFGDVLAEGLFNLIHVHRSVSVAMFPSYWDEVLLERRLLLAGILDRLTRPAASSRETRQCEKEFVAVRAGQDQLNRISAWSLAEFVGAWRYDLYRWNARLQGLPRFDRITEALTWLGVTDVQVVGAV